MKEDKILCRDSEKTDSSRKLDWKENAKEKSYKNLEEFHTHFALQVSFSSFWDSALILWSIQALVLVYIKKEYVKHQSAYLWAKPFEGDFCALAQGEHTMREKRTRTLGLTTGRRTSSEWTEDKVQRCRECISTQQDYAPGLLVGEKWKECISIYFSAKLYFCRLQTA